MHYVEDVIPTPNTMKTTQILVVFTTLLAGTAFGQVQTNELNTTGKVGVGTTNPSKELEVLGETRLDGKVEIIDDCEIKENLKVRKRCLLNKTLK
ncbi:MAG: hypothetical protein JKY54_00620 [Flavobacteriales bacterium]|nr:hypothetical protein [Flavobacteriales bacterium]